jgi:hypothetical protein
MPYFTPFWYTLFLFKSSLKPAKLCLKSGQTGLHCAGAGLTQMLESSSMKTSNVFMHLAFHLLVTEIAHFSNLIYGSLSYQEMQ